MDDADLYRRGAATLLASWEAFARGAAGAELRRLPGVGFPTSAGSSSTCRRTRRVASVAVVVRLPTALTPAAVAVALWVAAASGDTPGARAAGAVAAVALVAGYWVWRARGARWHEGLAILVLLPAVPAGVWVAVGGLALGEVESTTRRLALEVCPGLALVGLSATILGYHGRHDPRS